MNISKKICEKITGNREKKTVELRLPSTGSMLGKQHSTATASKFSSPALKKKGNIYYIILSEPKVNFIKIRKKMEKIKHETINEKSNFNL